MNKFRDIYYELVNNDMPVMRGGSKRSQARKTQMVRMFIVVASVGVFFFNTRMGLINRILISLIMGNSMLYLNKCLFYEKIVNEAKEEMTLTGQEARILVKYHFPDHPQIKKIQKNLDKYRVFSAEKRAEQEEFEKIERKKVVKEKKLDEEFEDKLREIKEIEDVDDLKFKDTPNSK